MSKVGLSLNSVICGCQAEAITSRNLWLPKGFGSIWVFNSPCRRDHCHPDALEVPCRWSIQPTRMEMPKVACTGVRCWQSFFVFFCLITAVKPNKRVSTEMWGHSFFFCLVSPFIFCPQNNRIFYEEVASFVSTYQRLQSCFLNRSGFHSRHSVRKQKLISC